MTDPDDLEVRLSRIEARLRAARIHDPSCPVRRVAEAQFIPIVVVDPNSCSCWLSE
jgi:hypothetical protein